MLRVTIPASKPKEYWDEKQEIFVNIPGTKAQVLQLEHSLVSLAKWESKWHKPFLTTKMTDEQTVDYIRCMTLTQNVPPEIYSAIPDSVIKEVSEYINDPATATWFSKEDKRPSREIVTAEIIYHWMIALNIPPEYQKWHLNRLMTLIRVCNIKNSPPKKMGKNNTLSRNAALNAARMKQLNTKG